MMLPPTIPATPFTWAQVHARGMSRHLLDDLVANRKVRRLLKGVYLRADVPDTPLIRAQAAALVVSRFVVVCDRTAGWVHGVDTFDYFELDVHPPLETYALRGHARTTRRECYGGSRDLAPSDICVIEGVKVTVPLRTALDLGCKLRRRDALAALDGFMRVHGVTRAEMHAQLSRYFRRRGVIQLRSLVPLADPRSESQGESWTRVEIIDAGLPAPEPQYWVIHEGRELFRLDLAYPHARVAVEYDGQEFHSSPLQREHDRARRNWLRDHGWHLIVVNKDSFGPDELSAWLDELRAALRLAAGHPVRRTA
jgi:hypothetical protein